jgi:hypothetical protein
MLTTLYCIVTRRESNDSASGGTDQRALGGIAHLGFLRIRIQGFAARCKYCSTQQ